VGEFFFFILGGITSDRRLIRKFHRIAYIFFGMVLVGMLSQGLSYAAYYQFFALNGWQGFWGNHVNMSAFLLGIKFFLILSPLLLVIIRPSLVFNNLLARSFDFAQVIYTPILIGAIITHRAEFIFTDFIFLFLLGLFFAWMGFRIIRTKESFFLLMSSLFWDTEDLLQRQAEEGAWLAWLSSRLPDPEDQKDLMQALEAAYPPSKWRTIGGAIVFGAGVWLLLEVLGAIVEWFVQG
jgi:hypothetical protein